MSKNEGIQYDPIELSVNSLLNRVNDLDQKVSELTDLAVKKDEVIKSINMSPESIKIIGNKIMVTADTYKEEK